MNTATHTALQRWCGLSIVVLTILAGCGGSANSTGDTGSAQAIPALPVTVGSTTSVTLGARRFLLYVPKSLGVGQRPVVLMLHGYAATPELTLTYDTLGRWNELAERDGFIVIYPASNGPAWDACGSGEADPNFLSDALAVVARSYPVDLQRVYAAGHSQGAQMVLRLARDRPQTYAAVMASEAPASNCGAGSKPVPVFLTYGTIDPLVSYAGNAQATLDFWLALNRTQAAPQVQRLPDLVVEDHSTIDESRYLATAAGADVQFWRMNGAGHAWPSPTAYPPSLEAMFGRRNQDVDGADAAWAFFQAHTMR
jgi:polyhydroxybutyrate depolymerase